MYEVETVCLPSTTAPTEYPILECPAYAACQSDWSHGSGPGPPGLRSFPVSPGLICARRMDDLLTGHDIGIGVGPQDAGTELGRKFPGASSMSGLTA